MTKIVITPKWTEVKPPGYYVYLHKRLSDGSPMYVGKGEKDRGWQKNRSDRWLFSARMHGVVVEVLQSDMTESDAFLLEMWMIAKLRHEGEDLCNLTDGGEGATGSISTRRRVTYCSNGMSFDCADDAARWLRDIGNQNATSKIVSACALGRKKSVYGYAFSHTGVPSQPSLTGKDAQRYPGTQSGINVYSSDGNSYSSAHVASRLLGGSGGSKILMACRGERFSAYGLTWSFNKDGPFPEYIDPMSRSNASKNKKIINDIGMEFRSMQAATAWIVVCKGKSYSASAIHQSIKRGGKCGGFSWFIVDN